MGVTETQPHGGRGARERILWAAARLFYAEGINATGMERLTQVAHVSKRTFYQHFPSKDALVEAYLEMFRTDTPREQALSRSDLAPRERLLALFDAPPDDAPLRGCPFHNAAVEVAAPSSPVRALVAGHKREFARRITEVAAEAGAADPDGLGRLLALLFDGATSLSTSLNDPAPFADARTAAAELIDVRTRP